MPGSTYETYREALALRRAERLGEGVLEWLDGYPADVVAFRTGEVLVLANTGATTVPLPDGAQVLLASVPLDLVGRALPADVTVWVRAR